MTIAAVPGAERFRGALRALGPDAGSAQVLADALGMRSIPNAVNLVGNAGPRSQLADALEGHLDGFYRVGEAELGGATAGLYLAYPNEWHVRSSERDRYRRKVARALIDHSTQDARWIVVLLDPLGKFREAEFVMPRVRVARAGADGAKPKGGVGTVRASVDLSDPNRYHLELLHDLAVPAGASIKDVSARWNQAFSVERVTKRFYEEFRTLRDRLIDALIEHNPEHPVLRGRDRKKDASFDLQLHAFGTRQLGRLLFLWFLQQKRWLGNSPGDGEPNFIPNRFQETRARPDSFFSDVLVPLFFDGIGLPREDPRHKAIIERFGPVPFLGGGLFRAGADEFEASLFGLQEDSDERTIEVVLPDDLFDPAKDQAEPGAKRASAERTVLGLLRGYRFTTQEATPDDQSVDPDPELLGKVFENLYQGDERHKTGAYYTPREIVHYMCRQALDGYLRERTGVSQEDIDWLRHEAEDWDTSDLRLDLDLEQRLFAALDDVKILDPAVGSGAFLLASIHEIVLLKTGIVQAKSDREVARSGMEIAEWKRHAATNCVYGVDINPMAVEICQLRLLLSIIVDLEVSDFKDVTPLPNLDLRVVAGDSLIDRMGDMPFMQSLPSPRAEDFDMFVRGQVEQLQKRVDKLRDRFAGEGVEHKQATLRRMRQEIREAQTQIARLQLDGHLTDARDAVANIPPLATQKEIRTREARLTNLQRLSDGLGEDKPFQKPFLWPVNFHDVFEAGGFDIVLANPPYVRQEELDAVDQEAYKHAFAGVYAGTADLLVFFYARAIQVLREGGHLAFITSNKYMRAAYGTGIRAHLPKSLQVQSVIDFGDLPLFDVAAYPAVLVGAKSSAPDPNGAVEVADLVYPIRRQLAAEALPANTDNVRLALEGLSGLLDEATVPDYPQVLLRSGGWILGDPALVRLFDRLVHEGKPLGEYVKGRMYRGVTSGFNDAFVIDQAKRDELIADEPQSVDLIKRWLRGRDIKRWHIDWANLYFIHVPWTIDIARYPAIAAHLERFKGPLAERPEAKRGVFPWWANSRWAADYYQEFDRPKVVWAKTAIEPQFAYDASGSYVGNTVHFLPDAPVWLANVLSSSLFEALYVFRTPLLRGGYIELTPDRLAPLPIRQPSPDIESELSRPTDDEHLGELTAKLYGLSDSEFHLILRLLAERRSMRGLDTGQPQPENDGDDD